MVAMISRFVESECAQQQAQADIRRGLDINRGALVQSYGGA